jgi:hypothetical protein
MEDEMEGQGHTSESLLRQSAMWHRTLNMHCFYMSAFSTSCYVLPVTDGKIKECTSIYIKFSVQHGKSTAKTLEMLCDDLESIL